MMQAGAPTIRAGFDPEADPSPPADDTSARTPLRLTIPLLLAAGWGALLTFSVMFLMEDGRAAVPASERTAAQAEDGSFAQDPYARPPVPDRPATIQLVSASADAPVAATAAATPAGRPPASPAVASSAVSAPRSPGLPSERRDYVGTWGPNAQACGRGHRHGYLPATISQDGARAGRTLCRFRDGHRDGIAWAMTAECSERGRRWTSQVRLLVDGDHLTWTSAKGPATYVRCGRRDG